MSRKGRKREAKKDLAKRYEPTPPFAKRRLFGNCSNLERIFQRAAASPSINGVQQLAATPNRPDHALGTKVIIIAGRACRDRRLFRPEEGDAD